MKSENDENDKLKNLKCYKYSSTDKSILTKYVFSHWYNYAITKVSSKIAPNTLTLIGFICMLLSTILTLTVDPFLNRGQSIKYEHSDHILNIASLFSKSKGFAKICQFISIFFSWIYYFLPIINGSLLFMYMTFDAIDGKQARRLNATSPLGQLFDHGCDALICFFTAITLTSTLGLGVFNIFLIGVKFAIVYYWCNIEEVFTGHFNLGYINGPSEGIASACIVHFLPFFFKNIYNRNGVIGSIFFKKVLFYQKINLTSFEMEVIIFVLVSLVVMSWKIIRNMNFGTKSELFNSILSILGLFSSVFILFQRNSSNILILYPLYFSFIFVFAKINLELSYARLKKHPLKDIPFGFSYYMLIFTAPFSSLMDISVFFYFIQTFITCFAYLDKVIEIIYEISDYLKISCFSIKEKEKLE